MMLPTPDLSHLTRQDFDRVYEPAEDTFILLDALEQDAEELAALRPSICLEVGSGSGCVSAFLASILGPSAPLYLCTDINLHACQCTIATGNQNKVHLESVQAFLTDPLSSRLAKSVDILIFNPPYVPTDTTEAEDGQILCDIQGSWAGGIDGMQVTEKLLVRLDSLLSAQGRFYLVAVKQNDIPGINQRLLDRSLISRVVLQRRAGTEHLFVLKITR